MKEFNLRESAEVEGISGQSLNDLNDPTAPKAKLAAAIIYVVKKRDNPDFTLDDAWDMSASEAGAILASIEVDDDPKAPKH